MKNGKKFILRIAVAMMCAAMAVSALPMAAFAEGEGNVAMQDAAAPAVTKTFEVSDSAGWVAAITEINAAESGNYVISLTGNVAISGQPIFEKNTTTILGNGYSLSGGNTSTIEVGKTAIVNLGSADKNVLTIQGATAGEGGVSGSLITMHDSTTVNMYDGVIIQDQTSNGSDAGVTMSGNAVFNMYGGVIKNCKDAFGQTTGGVGVGSAAGSSTDTCTFNMYDGEISNCSGGYGAGVRVGKGGKMTMSGGKITGCTSSQWGGGIYATQGTLKVSGGTISKNKATYGGGIAVTYMKYSLTSFFPYQFIVTGGTITENEAMSYGGGIMLYTSSTAQTVTNCTITKNKAQIGGGIMLMGNSQGDISGAGNVLCNNTATDGAADVFLNTSEDTIKLPLASSMNQTYRDSGKKIDGWYNDDSFYTPVKGAVAEEVEGKTLKGNLALVASYSIPETVTVTLVTSDGEPETKTVSYGEKFTKPADPTKDGYTFDGWYTNEECTDAFDFDTELTDDLTLYAKWTKQSAPSQPTNPVTPPSDNPIFTPGSSSTVKVPYTESHDEDCWTPEFIGKWLSSGGKTYYIESNDRMVKNGWQKIEKKYYYFDADGELIENSWILDGSKWYFVGEDGARLTNTEKDGYKLSASGSVVGQKPSLENYFDTASDSVHDHFTSSCKDKDCWRGKFRERWVLCEGNWYYIKDSEVPAQSEWVKSGNSWYHFDKNQVMQYATWLNDGGKWYYLGADGAMYSNRWRCTRGVWYYLLGNGEMAKNRWIEDKGNWYYLGADGGMLVDTTTPDGFRVDENGVWMK